jgi:hypothetical protein
MTNKEVMVYSVKRTGSTFIWQCLKKIFTNVAKAHATKVWPDTTGGIRITTSKKGAVLDFSCPCVITERDAMDTFLSHWRNDNPQTEAFFHDWLLTAYGDTTPRTVRYPIKDYSGWTNKNDSSQVLDMAKFKEACDTKTESCYVDGYFKPGPLAIRSVREIAVSYREEVASLEKVKKEYKGPVLVLQYENFVNDYDYIFSNFEDFFDITISEETKTEIKDATNRNANQKKQEALKGVGEHDNPTHLHGGHIFTGEVGWSAQVLREKNLARMQTLLTCDPSEIMTIDLGP